MITPKELAFALEYFRLTYYPHLSKSRYQDVVARRFGWAATSVRNWISGRTPIPVEIDYICRVRYNYPELSYDYAETLPLPSDGPPVSRSSHVSRVQLEAASELFGLMFYYRNWGEDEMWWCDRLKAFWGIDADVVPTGELFRKGIHPGDLERVEAGLHHYLSGKGGTFYTTKFRMINLKDGSKHRVYARSSMVLRDHKPIASAGVVIVDS